MSRMHPSQNKSELYDAYISTMLKNGKRVEKPLRNDVGRLPRDKNLNSNNNGQLVVSRPAIKFASKNEEQQLRAKPSDEELVRKEVFNNNMATVEVTVRTVGPKGSSADKCMSDDRREPWGKLLMNRRSEENVQGSFGNFDPLRTLHFLSKELQMKLQSICPSDANVQQIVNDMENAIHRLPPDVLSQLKPNMMYEGDVGVEIPISIKKSTNIAKAEAQTQTVIVGDGETKKMQMQLEDSANKLEASCKEMEELCKKLRVERDELETMLQDERRTVVSLRQELNEVISDKDTKTMKELNKIIAERDVLRSQIEDLRNQLESKVNRSTEDLRNLIEGLKEKQLVSEQEATLVRTELTLLKLEKDKLNVLLECRDKQLKELRNELETIQQLVNAQLQESRAKPTFSATSTISSVSGIWNVPSRRTQQKYGKSIHELFMNNDVMRRVLIDKDIKMCDSFATTMMEEASKMSNLKLKDIQVIPQKEIQTTSQLTLSDIGISTENFMHSSQPSIQDMFAEIKRQAFMKIATPLPSKSQIIKKKSSSNVNIYTSAQESSQDSESSS